MTLYVRCMSLYWLTLPDLNCSYRVAVMPSFGCGNFQADKGHVLGGALSMKWEGRGPLLVVAEILPLQCG